MPKRTEAGLPVLRLRPVPKGRPVDPAAVAEVRALLGDEPLRRDLLIEHVHVLQDEFDHLSDRHLLALAREMRLSPAEVYEVATFYEHWDMVGDGEPPPELTVRVCDSLSCELAGSASLLTELRERLGDGVRVKAAACMGRCDTAPSVFVNRRGIPHATAELVEAAVGEGRIEPVVPEYRELEAYRRGGGYELLKDCVAGQRTVESVTAELEASQLKGLGGAGFPAARKWGFVRAGRRPGCWW
jgi:formate dehydrogenase beta subunit